MSARQRPGSGSGVRETSSLVVALVLVAGLFSSTLTFGLLLALAGH